MMKHLNEFVNWVNNIQEVKFLVEGKGHMDHPEDMVILGGIADFTPLSKTLQLMDQMAKSPGNITIKFDGYPALVFGSGPDGKFSIMDKHMFNRGQNRPKIHSAKEFAAYEAARGDRERSDLAALVAKIWPSLEASYNGPGWYMCDLMFSSPLQEVDGTYTFRPNPNGIEYKVDANSDFAKKYKLGSAQAGVAVHRWLPPEANTTEDQVTWLSDLGNLKQQGNVAILPVSMPVKPNISIDKSLRSKAYSATNAESEIYDFIAGSPYGNPATFANHFTVYLNSRIASKNLSGIASGFYPWFEQRLNKQLAEKKIGQTRYNEVLQYIKENKAVITQLFKNWIDVYNYKMSIVKQLDKAAQQSPVKGYLQTGKESQEGFVFGGLKFVDRLGFSAQNLAGRQQVAEAVDGKEILVVYPGGFHPFHRGHSSVYNHLTKKFPGSDVYVAATDTRSERPFSFDDKQFLAGQSGVPADNFVQVKSPYQAKEITQAYDPKKTILVFAISEKDKDRFNFAPKKDGSPSYFQPWSDNADSTMDKHGYIYVVPKVDFKIAGETVDSASKIRNMYSSGDDNLRQKIVMDLYPAATEPKKVKEILDSTLGGLTEADNPNYFGGSSVSAIPGTPADLMPGPSKEEVEDYHKEMADLKRFMRHR